MKKSLLCAVALVLSIGVLFAGCKIAGPIADPTATPLPTADRGEDPVVITVGGQEVTLNTYMGYYQYYAQQFGVEEDTGDFAQYVKEVVVEMIIEENLLVEYARSNNITLGKDDLAEAETLYGQYIDNYNSQGAEALAAEGISEEDPDYEMRLAAAADDAMWQEGYTRTSLEEAINNAFLTQKAQEDMIKNAAVTQEDIKAYYDEKLLEQEEEFALNPSAFEEAVTAADTCYQARARKVRHILLALTTEQQNEISALRNGSDTVEADAAAADAKRAEYLGLIADDAEAARGRVMSGDEEFGEVMRELSADVNSFDGLYVAENSTTYVESFTKAVWALKNLREVSPLVASDFGYHIIILDKEIERGPIPFEDVQEALEADCLEVKKSELYAAAVEVIRAKVAISVDYAALGMTEPVAATPTPAPTQDGDEGSGEE